MSQTPHVKVYRTNLGDVSPFQRKIVPKRNKKNSKKSSNNDSEESGKGSSEERGKGPSGSHWSTSQLNWLGILFQDELNIEEVFTTKYILSDKIIQVIRKAIYAEKHWTWAEVEANEDLFEEESWFNRLLILTSICRESRGYSQSSPLQPSLSEQNQGSESLDCDEHDSKSPTPRPKTLRNVTTAEPGEKARAHFVLPEESEGLSTFPPSTSGSQSPTVGADEPRLPSLPVAPSAASSRKRPARFVRSPGHRNTTEPESPGLSDRSTPPKRIKEQFPPRALPDFTNHEKSSSRALKQAEDVRSDRKDKDGNEDGNVDVQKEDEDEIEDKGEDDGQDEGDNEGGNEDEGEHTKEKGPSAALPDTIHKATSSRASKSAEDVASPNQDKDEEEVKSAAHAFLDIIANALKAAAPKMPTQVMYLIRIMLLESAKQVQEIKRAQNCN